MLAEEKKESGGRLEESRRDPQDERKYLITSGLTFFFILLTLGSDVIGGIP